MKKILIVIPIIFATLILVGWFAYTNAINSATGPLASEVVFVIESGESLQSIGQRLENEGIIASAFWFRVYGQLHPETAANVQAGEYVFVESVSVVEAYESFQLGLFEQRLTFLEGWRREQMAEYLAKVYDEQFGKDFLLASEGMEGMLFPDTYIVGKSITPNGLVTILATTYEEKMIGERNVQLELSELTEIELLIIASIVEREVISQEDREIVAGIMLKRRENGWPLEADATVQYAKASRDCSVFTDCEWWSKEITHQDLQIDSAYNTRKNIGLPPGPIAAPGITAIDAVLNAEESPYWFYLSDSEGITRFAATLEEHNQNVVHYLTD